MTPGILSKNSQAGFPVRLSSWKGIQCLATRALAQGARHRTLTEVAWQAAGRCERPLTLQASGRKEDLRGFRGIGGTGMFREGEIRKNGETVYMGPILLGAAPMGSLAVTMDVRCRRCVACLRARGRKWRDRAQAEVAQSGRTWMGTLTLRPSAYSQFEAKAQLEFARGVEHKYRKARSLDNWACGDGPAPTWDVKRGGSFTDWWKLPELERVKRVERTVYREISGMLKRIRKQTGVTGIRFLCVFERENSEKEFFLHAHLLLHEPPNAQVRYKDLKSRVANRLRQLEPDKPERVLGPQWSHGFTNWQLLPEGKSGYVTKYVAKSAATVISSKGYGSSQEQALSAQKALPASVGGGTTASDRPSQRTLSETDLTDRWSTQRAVKEETRPAGEEDSVGDTLGLRMPRHPSQPDNEISSSPARDAAPPSLSPHPVYGPDVYSGSGDFQSDATEG